MPDSAPKINTYVSDMIALERHILTPLQAQADDKAFQRIPSAIRCIGNTITTAENHIHQLEARLEALGGHSGVDVKTGVASMMGAMASAIDNVRKTEVSKSLRDDYTALCLGSVSYTMLHATASGLHDQMTADLATSHLRDYATLIMQINAVIPNVVLKELSDLGAPVDMQVIEKARKEEENAWQEASHATVGAGR